MNKDTLEGNWHILKGKIKNKWARFNNNELEALNGNLENLSGALQVRYGYAKDKADKEYSEFKASLRDVSKDSPKEFQDVPKA